MFLHEHFIGDFELWWDKVSLAIIANGMETV
jgi:hypothetical protein